MKPPKSEKIDYEKVSVDDFVTGTIAEIQYDKEHLFKGFDGSADKKRPAARFKFALDGYNYPHYSRWMSFSYGEKSNLYLKYLVPLVENAQPDMDFDLDLLKGMKVKTLWSEKNGFQNIETIRPIGRKFAFLPGELPVIQMDESELQPDDEVPF